MKIKKALLAISIIGAGLITAACGSGGGKEASSSKETKIEVFNIKVETKDQLEALAKKYEEKHKDVKINITTVGGGQDANAALQSKFSSGDEPSIFLLGGLSDVEKWQDKLLDVSDMELTKKAIAGTTDGTTVDGKVYGLPMNIEGYGLLINQEIFKKAGVDVAGIQSFADFEAAVKKVDSQKEKLGLKAVFGFSAKEFWVVSQYSSHFLSAEFDNSLDKIYQAKTIDYKYGEIFKKYTDLINKYNVQPILSLDYSTSVEEYFANDQVAVIHQGNWIIPTLNSLDPAIAKEKLGIVPMFIEEGSKGTVAAGPSWYWGINKNKDDAVVKESQKFLEWMYTDKEAMTSLIEDFQYIPAYTNFSEDAIKDPLSKTIFTYLSEGKTTPWAHNQFPDGFSQTQFYPEFQKYLNGDITWEELEKTTKAEWESDR